MRMNAMPATTLLAAAVLAACAGHVAPSTAASAQPLPALQNPQSVHCSAVAIDSHIDVPNNFATAEVDPGADTEAQLTLAKMQRGCLDAAFFVAAVGQNSRTPAGYEHAWNEAQKMIAGVHRMTQQYPQRIALARNADDVERIAGEGRHAALIGLENAYPLGPDLRRLGTLFDLGVRYITLTHIGHNAFADSSVPIKELGDADEEHGGLSPLGRDLIREMNCLGILVDVSHTSRKTTLQSIEASAAPVIASHSAARAVANSPRNMDDEQLQALARRGGVVQVVGYSNYVKLNSAEKDQAIAKVSEELGLSGSMAWAKASNETLVNYGHRLVELDQRWPRASVADYVDHVDHIVKLAGVEHVGIGSDFYAGGGAASGGLAGWMDVGANTHITEELLRRGYSAADVRKIWGGNLLRVMHESEKVARTCSAQQRR